ncbi:MAG: right-handed parallel beta-helix repeat-containing protein [Rectinemataceae bacterium]
MATTAVGSTLTIAAPTTLNAGTPTTAGVPLSWPSSVSPSVDYYWVYYGTSSVFADYIYWAGVDPVAGAMQSFTFPALDLTPNTPYYFWVSAATPSGESSPTPVLSGPITTAAGTAGVLLADGTSKPIVFKATTAQDFTGSYTQAWGTISIASGCTATIRNATIQDSGISAWAVVSEGVLVLESCTIKDNWYGGIDATWAEPGSIVRNNVFGNNNYYDPVNTVLSDLAVGGNKDVVTSGNTKSGGGTLVLGR